ncbi:MAG: ABC transporter permease [Muribaculum sp.]|nr:ABC transporter permease [Muribaculum sp.]
MKSYLKFLSRNKAYAAIDIFGLAISMMFVVLIGCYTWQESHIDKQHSKADRMYYLGLDFSGQKVSGGHWREQFMLRDKFPEIESSTAIFRNTRWLDYNDVPIETNCYFVDSTFYDIFDFKLIQGDPKTALDNPSGVVVTQEYAHRVWGDKDPMGQSIVFNSNERPFVVTGVMESMTNTAFMTSDKRPVDMLLNFEMMKYVNESIVDERMTNGTGTDIILLSKEGTDLTKRKKEYEAALKDQFWIFQLPEDNIRLEIYPFEGSYFSEMRSSNNNMNFGDGKMVKLLFSVGLVILLFAVMNYINLTVALAGKRAKEMATRRLLGEERREIMWRLIGESTILCAVSMIIGIALAFAAQPYASSLLKTPIDIIGCVNATTIGFLLFILIVMGFTSGIVPAMLLSSVKPVDAMKGAYTRKSNMVFGKIFIVIQNVATITMVASAITMYCQVQHLINAPLGYNTEGIIEIDYNYIYGENKDELFKNELLKLPCVEKISYCAGTPLQGGNNNTMEYQGKTISFQTFIVDSVYMDILGLKLKKDNHVASDVKMYFDTRAFNELGLDEDAYDFQYYEYKEQIAGILEDFHIRTILDDQHPLRMTIAKPFEHFRPWSVIIKVRGDEKEALTQVRDVFERVFSKDYADVAFEMPYISQKIEARFDGQKRLSVIISIFAVIAVMISMLGLVAMSTYYVRQRSQDIAVRKVMGGTSMEVLTQLVRTFMLYVVIAAVISIPVIYYVMNDWLSEFSYRISIYWWIYALSILMALIICFISVVIQCRAAANANPINSLK